MNKNVSSYPFKVEPFQEDFSGRLAWGVLGNHLLRCASLHAGEHGFGYEQMSAIGHAWVLSRLVIEMDCRPRSGERYDIATWVGRIYRQFTDRFFTISDETGQPFGHAYSVWALIDIHSRQPAELGKGGSFDFSQMLIPDRTVPIAGPSRIRVKAEKPAMSVTSRYTDLDVNGHVNSIRYIEHILNFFPKETYEQKQVRRIEAAYSAETYCEETLSIFVEEQACGQFCADIRKADGRTAAKAEVVFEET